jgi:hypothetical protein
MNVQRHSEIDQHIKLRRGAIEKDAKLSVIIPILGMNCLMERENTSENFDKTGAIFQFWPKMAILCRGCVVRIHTIC